MVDKRRGTSVRARFPRPIFPVEKDPLELRYRDSTLDQKDGYQSNSTLQVREGKLKIETSPVRCIGHDAFEAPYLRAPLNKRTLANSRFSLFSRSPFPPSLTLSLSFLPVLSLPANTSQAAPLDRGAFEFEGNVRSVRSARTVSRSIVTKKRGPRTLLDANASRTMSAVFNAPPEILCE